MVLVSQKPWIKSEYKSTHFHPLYISSILSNPLMSSLESLVIRRCTTAAQVLPCESAYIWWARKTTGQVSSKRASPMLRVLDTQFCSGSNTILNIPANTQNPHPSSSIAETPVVTSNLQWYSQNTHCIFPHPPPEPFPFPFQLLAVSAFETTATRKRLNTV